MDGCGYSKVAVATGAVGRGATTCRMVAVFQQEVTRTLSVYNAQITA